MIAIGKRYFIRTVSYAFTGTVEDFSALAGAGAFIALGDDARTVFDTGALAPFFKTGRGREEEPSPRVRIAWQAVTDWNELDQAQ